MRDLTEHQLEALQQLFTNATTIILGTVVLGRFFTGGEFIWSQFISGVTIYVSLLWMIMKVAAKRRR